MRKLFLFLLLFAFAAPLHARLRWGIRAGALVNGGTDPMFGAEMILPMGNHFLFNPNVEVSPGDPDVVTTSADIHYDIDLGSGTAFWIGAGVASIIPESDLEIGVNLLAGIGVRSSRWYPYVQVRRTIPMDYDSYNSIAVGLRF